MQMVKFNDTVIICLCFFCARVSCWSCYQDNCYYRSTSEMDWMSSVAYCGYIGSTIASIHSWYENLYVHSVCGSNNCWIGLTDKYYEGRFRWADGTPFNYHWWNSGEPNDYNGEDMVYMRSSGNWNDDSWDSSHYVICMKPSPTPSPTREPSYPWPTCQPTTLVPTQPPSPYPTTTGPTMMPTLQPTYRPSVLPSSEPTQSPSDLPSLEPTYSPSVLPTFGPTPLPSTQPTTHALTIYPFKSPTSSPTAAPTHPNPQYCIERVKLHFASIVLAGCFAICTLCIILLRRSTRNVVLSPMIFSPKTFSPKRFRIERSRVQSKPEDIPTISMKDLAFESVSNVGLEGITECEVGETVMTPV